MNPNLIHNAVLKTTILYLAIIMSISTVFSLGIYRISSQEIERSIGREQGPINKIIRTNNPELIEEILNAQIRAVDEAQNRLKANLLLTNVMILVFSGLLSYLLARKTLEPIEKAHQAQSRFTADASHELRTPITAMRAETELTLTEPKLTLKEAKQQLTSNIEELDKLTQLSESLLQLSNLEISSIEKTKVSIPLILKHSIERVDKKAKIKSISIKNQNKLKTKILVNKSIISEAIVVLLDNAIKYSSDNSEIAINTIKNKSSVKISITDTGIGIRASDMPYIFDRFYRADSSRSKDKIDGYGIGLSIAKLAVEAHGGGINVNSTPDKGSTFTVTIPLQ